MNKTLRWQSGLVWALTIMIVAPAIAQVDNAGKPGNEFYRGFYLRHHDRDFEQAAAAFENAVKLGLKGDLRDQARQAILELEEELVTQDFAALMPKDSLGYIEISDPAKHIELLAKAMGLVGQEFDSSQRATLQLEDGFAISSDFQLSPALLREIKKFRGVAISITDINQSGPPVSGLAVIHPGDSDLLGGILETGVQLIPATENIQGFPTFNIENDVWLVKTHRLILVADSKAQIEAGLRRLEKSEPGLNTLDTFKKARVDAADTAAFAFVNPAIALEKYGRAMRGEAAIARVALDLDHLEFVSAAIKATEGGVQSQLEVRYREGHNSLAMGMIRTAPLGETSLKLIPQGTAAVAGLGVNPQMVLAAQAAGSSQLSALDIGRELFANIKEVSFFVLPSVDSSTGGIPDFGIVVVSNDVSKSDKLWNELMSLPSQMDLKEGPQVHDLTIGDYQCREYQFPDPGMPRLVITRIENQALIAGSPAGVAAVLESHSSNQNLANDPHATAFWDAKTSQTSKVFHVNVGHAIALAAQLEQSRDVQQLAQFAHLAKDLCLTTVVDESDENLLVKTSLTGLPKFEHVIQALAKTQSGYAARRIETRTQIDQPSASDIISTRDERSGQ